MVSPEIGLLLLTYSLQRSFEHARSGMRIYQALAQREPHTERRAVLLQLALSEERRAARQALALAPTASLFA